MLIPLKAYCIFPSFLFRTSLILDKYSVCDRHSKYLDILKKLMLFKWLFHNVKAWRNYLSQTFRQTLKYLSFVVGNFSSWFCNLQWFHQEQRTQLLCDEFPWLQIWKPSTTYKAAFSFANLHGNCSQHLLVCSKCKNTSQSNDETQQRENLIGLNALFG